MLRLLALSAPVALVAAKETQVFHAEVTAFDNEAEVFPQYAKDADKTEFTTGSVTAEGDTTEFTTGAVTAFEGEAPGTTVFTTGGVTAFDNEDEVFPQYSAEAKEADKTVFTTGSVGDDKVEFTSGSVTAEGDSDLTVFTNGGVTAFDNEDEVFPEYAKEANKVEFTTGSVGDDKVEFTTGSVTAEGDSDLTVFTNGGVTAFDNEDEVFPEYAKEANKVEFTTGSVGDDKVEFTTGSVTAEGDSDLIVFTNGGVTAFDNEDEVFPEYAKEANKVEFTTGSVGDDKAEFSTGSVTAFEGEDPDKTEFTTGSVTAEGEEVQTFSGGVTAFEGETFDGKMEFGEGAVTGEEEASRPVVSKVQARKGGRKGLRNF